MEKLKILGSVTSEVMLGSTTVPVTFLVTEEFIAPALLGNRELTKFNVSINLLNKLLFVGENQEPVPFSLSTLLPHWGRLVRTVLPFWPAPSQFLPDQPDL
jgi:hypothetical protein